MNVTIGRVDNVMTICYSYIVTEITTSEREVCITTEREREREREREIIQQREILQQR